MGIFFTSPSPKSPAIAAAFEEALLVDPQNLGGRDAIKQIAANRTVRLAEDTSHKFHPWRFAGALLIAVGLLLAAIWTGQHNLPDISTKLMDSFAGFFGIVVGLLGGEAPKS